MGSVAKSKGSKIVREKTKTKNKGKAKNRVFPSADDPASKFGGRFAEKFRKRKLKSRKKSL